MSFRQGFFVVRDLPESALPEALLAAASHAPADAAYERFVLERCGPWSAALILDQYGFAHRWAQAVSFERRGTAVSFLILEGTWSYAIFDSGAHVLGMQFFPHPRPLLEGNANKAAALLGCPADIFGRYHAAILAACDAPEAAEYPRAYEDDEYEAADEYGFMDFAQRAGIPGDPPFGTEPIGIHADTPRPPTWVGLPPMPHIYASD